MKRLAFLLTLLLGTSVLWVGPSVLAEEAAREPVEAAREPEEAAREPVDWLRDGVIYQINPRAFTPEGTLRAAEKKMPDVAELGVTIVYLCPVFVADDDMDRNFWSPRQKKSKMDSPKNPYRMKDYYHVDPEYGTDADLRSFVKTCHALGMKVMLDLVYLHCGPKAVFLDEHPDFVKRDKEGKILNEAWAFPGLNFESPALREYLWANMEYYLRDFDVDGYRMDVADGIPLDFWEEGRRRMEKIKPNVGALAEGVRAENLRFAFDLNYGFALQGVYKDVVVKGESAMKLRQTKDRMAAAIKGARYMLCVDNHDISCDDWDQRREKTFTEKGMNAVLTLLFTLDGTPMLYCGQEMCDQRRHSIFGSKGGCFLHWEDAKTDAACRRKALLQHLAQQRRENPEFTRGAMEWRDNSTPNDVISFERVLGDVRSLVVINFRSKPVETVVKMPDGTDQRLRLDPFGTWIQVGR